MGRSTCVHCGKHPAETLDHVPPKNLFPSPRPANLITVPACRPCNNGASKDDEYFRDMLVFREGADDHPAGKSILDAASRSLTRPQSRRYQVAFARSAFWTNRTSRAGLHLPPVMAYRPDLPRLDRVVSRTMRGLLFHTAGPEALRDVEIRAFAADGLSHVLDHNADLAKVVLTLISGPPRVIGDGVFGFWLQLARGPKGETGAAAVLLFFERFWWLALAGPRSEFGHGPRTTGSSVLRGTR